MRMTPEQLDVIRNRKVRLGADAIWTLKDDRDALIEELLARDGELASRGEQIDALKADVDRLSEMGPAIHTATMHRDFELIVNARRDGLRDGTITSAEVASALATVVKMYAVVGMDWRRRARTLRAVAEGQHQTMKEQAQALAACEQRIERMGDLIGRMGDENTRLVAEAESLRAQVSACHASSWATAGRAARAEQETGDTQ